MKAHISTHLFFCQRIHDLIWDGILISIKEKCSDLDPRRNVLDPEPCFRVTIRGEGLGLDGDTIDACTFDPCRMLIPVTIDPRHY